ncbi:MAG: alpha/beta hydrolase [Parvularculaceae bacterium]|nr:alpha/beta hydrolase [Caulobacterales bacterium]
MTRKMREGTVELPNGLSMHYYEWPGNGPKLLLLHPTCGYGRIWEWLADALGDKFHIFAPDQRGHGYSGRPNGSYSADEYADDAELFAEAVGIDRAIVFGHSLGSRVGQVFAARYPNRAYALILTAPHLSNFYMTREDAKAVLETAASNLHHPERFASREQAFTYMRARWPWTPDPDEALNHRIDYNFHHHQDGSVSPHYDIVRVSQGLTHLSDDLRPYAAAVKCPVLILRAASGKLSSQDAIELAKFWGDARVVDVEGTYAVQLESPVATAEAIAEFAGAIDVK